MRFSQKKSSFPRKKKLQTLKLKLEQKKKILTEKCSPSDDIESKRNNNTVPSYLEDLPWPSWMVVGGQASPLHHRANRSRTFIKYPLINPVHIHYKLDGWASFHFPFLPELVGGVRALFEDFEKMTWCGCCTLGPPRNWDHGRWQTDWMEGTESMIFMEYL